MTSEFLNSVLVPYDSLRVKSATSSQDTTASAKLIEKANGRVGRIVAKCLADNILYEIAWQSGCQNWMGWLATIVATNAVL